MYVMLSYHCVFAVVSFKPLSTCKGTFSSLWVAAILFPDLSKILVISDTMAFVSGFQQKSLTFFFSTTKIRMRLRDIYWRIA